MSKILSDEDGDTIWNDPTPNIDDEIIRTLTLNLLSEYQQLETPANPNQYKGED